MKRGLTPGIDKCDVLVVDDDENYRLLISKVIQKTIPNARTMTAEDGAEGYQLALRFRPRIVWTCIRMPRMDGLEMIRLIRKNPDIANTKILVFTGYGGKDVTKRAIEFGADILLSKGSRETFEEALSVIAEWLAEPRPDLIDEVKNQRVEEPTQEAGEDDPWSITHKIKCKRCGQYNPIEKSIGSQADNGGVEWFADFYTCSYCGHRGRRLIHQVAKMRDDGKQKPYDNVEGVFYQEDIS